MIFPLFVFAIIGASLALPYEDVEPIAGLSEGADNPAEKSKYVIFGQTNFFGAIETCFNRDMRLVVIDNQRKNNEVTNFINEVSAINGPFFIMANRLYDDTTWTFQYGNPVEYFNWSYDEPNNLSGNEKCVEIYKNGKWNDVDCGYERFVLCEVA